MSISKGSDYGRRGQVPSDAPIASSDESLRAILLECRGAESSVPIIRLTGGDLHRTLGGVGSSPVPHDGGSLIAPVDLVEVVADGFTTVFVAHLIAGPLFGRNFVAAMNAQWAGPLDLGPRSHPGDGLVDVTSGSLGITQRRAARRRATSGTHVPHPSLKVERVREWTVEFDRPTKVVVDGVRAGSTRRLSIRVIPDAFEVAI